MALDVKEKELARKRRGEITKEDLLTYLNWSDSQLITLLQEKEAKQRAVGATLLGNRQCFAAIHELCEALQREKALYARLAIANALSEMGEPVILPLCGFLGKIGSNHETELPDRCCTKQCYPLVRDLAGRILVKIGAQAVPALIDILTKGKLCQIEHAIDTLGAIAYRTGDQTSLRSLLRLKDRFQNNAFITWKIVRSLGGFRSREAVNTLLAILHQSPWPALRWEAARSIGQIGFCDQMILIELEKALQDPDRRVGDAVRNALKRLHKNS